MIIELAILSVVAIWVFVAYHGVMFHIEWMRTRPTDRSVASRFLDSRNAMLVADLSAECRFHRRRMMVGLVIFALSVLLSAIGIGVFCPCK
jgi:hypothetical protein